MKRPGCVSRLPVKARISVCSMLIGAPLSYLFSSFSQTWRNLLVTARLNNLEKFRLLFFFLGTVFGPKSCEYWGVVTLFYRRQAAVILFIFGERCAECVKYG